MALLRHRDDEAEREAQYARVHGVERTCSMCGTLTTCDVTEVVHRTGIDGVDHAFGTCRACMRLGTEWPRKVAAVLLGIDPDAVLLDGVRIDRFVDRPGARPDQPNGRAWAHVNRQTLTKQAEANAADLDRRTGGPCYVCGTTVTPKGTHWVNGRLVQCGRCLRWLDHRQPSQGSASISPDVRILAATVLLGRSTPTVREMGPPGVADEIGMTLWADSGMSKGTVIPFGWLDVVAINERLRQRGSSERVDIGRWTAIDRYRV